MSFPGCHIFNDPIEALYEFFYFSVCAIKYLLTPAEHWGGLIHEKVG